MSENTSETREIVIPGEILSNDTDMIPGRGAIREGNNKIISIFIGLKDIRGKYVNVVPLKGTYTPEMGDKVIGKIVDKTAVKWRVDINGKTTGILKPSEVLDSKSRRSYGGGQRKGRSSREDEINAMDMFKLGDMLICTVVSTDRVSDPVLSTLGESLGKINNGIVIDIDVPKIPRVIGKRGSMIKLLKDLTHCKMFVSKNGRIWLSGKTEKYERLLIDVIYKIEREAHTTGLTDRVQNYIQMEKKERGID